MASFPSRLSEEANREKTWIVQKDEGNATSWPTVKGQSQKGWRILLFCYINHNMLPLTVTINMTHRLTIYIYMYISFHERGPLDQYLSDKDWRHLWKWKISIFLNIEINLWDMHILSEWAISCAFTFKEVRLFSAMRHANLLLNGIQGYTLQRYIFFLRDISWFWNLCNGDLKFDIYVSCFKDIYLPSYLKNIYLSRYIYPGISINYY